MLEIQDLGTSLIGPISLTVAPGECVVVRGASGSGKSLFLRAVADLDPNTGDALIDGRRRNRMPAPDWRRLVAFVPAESGWWAERVAAHFEAESDTALLLAAVGLPDAMAWDVSRLSTGERQRLAFVRALAGRPHALLLDEPTSALDEYATQRVEDIIREQCTRGTCVILVSHDKEQSRRLATRSFLMQHGRLTPESEAEP